MTIAGANDLLDRFPGLPDLAEQTAILYFSAKVEPAEFMDFEDMRYQAILAMCIELARMDDMSDAEEALRRLRYCARYAVRNMKSSAFRLRRVCLSNATAIKVPMKDPDHPKFRQTICGWEPVESGRWIQLWHAADDSPEVLDYANAYLDDHKLRPYLRLLMDSVNTKQT